ncbi:MAG: hypothetical protein HOF89_04040 [Candidatus Nitrosopelagicus sp.]|nr:hypothetical protein [Candidatus Nitrosopelagicus sp.]
MQTNWYCKGLQNLTCICGERQAEILWLPISFGNCKESTWAAQRRREKL